MGVAIEDVWCCSSSENGPSRRECLVEVEVEVPIEIQVGRGMQNPGKVGRKERVVKYWEPWASETNARHARKVRSDNDKEQGREGRSGRGRGSDRAPCCCPV